MLSVIPLLNRINKQILNPVIILMFAVSMLVFFWGVFEFVSKANENAERERGKQNMMWGLVGMFIMISVYGIIRVILSTFGISDPPYIVL